MKWEKDAGCLDHPEKTGGAGDGEEDDEWGLLLNKLRCERSPQLSSCPFLCFTKHAHLCEGAKGFDYGMNHGRWSLAESQSTIRDGSTIKSEMAMKP